MAMDVRTIDVSPLGSKAGETPAWRKVTALVDGREVRVELSEDQTRRLCELAGHMVAGAIVDAAAGV